MKAYSLFAAVTLISSGVAAQTAAPTDQGTSEAPQEEKKICRTQRATGSLTRVNRICLTQAEWDRLSQNTRKDVDDLSRRAGTNTGGGGTGGGGNFGGL